MAYDCPADSTAAEDSYGVSDTPGCTAQACELRDQYSLFRERGAVVLGVSPDDEYSHARFREKYSLPFTLLADPGHHVAEDYGVWGKGESSARPSSSTRTATWPPRYGG